MADAVVKLTSVCALCHLDAPFTARTISDERIELVGGAEMYVPLCRKCYDAAHHQHTAAAAAAVTADAVAEPHAAAAHVGYTTPAKSKGPATPSLTASPSDNSVSSPSSVLTAELSPVYSDSSAEPGLAM